MGISSVKLVSFSGIDGAGKSTQIDAFCKHLQESGIQYSLFTFWDDVVVLSRWRERASLHAFKGDKGVGSPEKPITRRDKNVRSWYLSAVRLMFYLLDTLSLCSVIARSAESGVDFIVFDRYIYDELANLPLQYSFVRLYIRALLMFIPKPDVALLLDADPEAATSRKPEYPLEFVRHNRDTYMRLGRLVGMTVVPPLPIQQATEVIRDAVAEKCGERDATPRDLQVKFPSAAESAKASSAQNVSTSC
jgi:thymidylate kinase